MRWRWPPLSWWGYFSRTSSPRSPTTLSASSVISRASALLEAILKFLMTMSKICLNLIERVVNGIRVLENGLHVAPVVVQLAPGHGGDVGALVDDLARRQFREAQDHIGERRLAAAALAGDCGDAGRTLWNDQVEVLEGDRRGAARQEAAAIDFGCVANFKQ